MRVVDREDERWRATDMGKLLPNNATIWGKDAAERLTNR
jgi:hypothetical protein